MLQRPTLPDASRLSFHRNRLDFPNDRLDFPAASTPVPNLLIDRTMPELSDTEWRLLCVVCRQTLGFASADGQGGRRARDWLTHRQLKARTGRASAAVSRAVDGLVRKNLIEVHSLDGTLLLTPPERRRCQGALLFSLSPRLLREAAGGKNAGSPYGDKGGG